MILESFEFLHQFMIGILRKLDQKPKEKNLNFVGQPENEFHFQIFRDLYAFAVRLWS